MTGERLAGAAVAAILLALAAAPMAGATPMTLKGGKPEVDRSGQLNAYNSTWDSPDSGGTVTWTNAYWTGTYTFPVPSAIPDDGVTFDAVVKAESRKNEYGYDTNFAPAMSFSGSMVTGGTVAVSARSDSGTMPSDTQSKPVTLKPVNFESVVTVGIQDGPVYKYTFVPEPAPGTTPTPTPTAAPTPAPTNNDCKPAFAARAGGSIWAKAAAINEVRVVSFVPGVAFHRAGRPDDEWCEVEKDTVLKQGDEISCDPDGHVVLQFADNSTVLVQNTSQLKIASFFTEGGVVRTEILLKMGEVAAKVCKSCGDVKSDFVLKSNYHQGSVRGTEFSAFVDPGSGLSLWSVRAGSVAVSNGKGSEKLITAGKEVMVSKAGKFKTGKIGKAGAIGGVTAKQALARVLKAVAKANGPCGVTTPRLNATSVKAAKRDWKVSVKVLGKLKGTSSWRVRGKRVTAVNALAKRLKRSCK